MNKKENISSAYKILKDRMHTNIYLVPESPINNTHPYFICDDKGEVLFVSYEMGVWVEIDEVPKQLLNNSTILTEDKVFMFSTLI